MSILLMGLFGFVAVAVDTGVWYSTKRRLQTAADAAARAAVFEAERKDIVNPDPQTAAETAAARFGFDAARQAVVQVDVRENKTVGAQITVPAAMAFTRILRVTAPSLSAQAAAMPAGRPPPCLTILDPEKPRTLEVGDTAKIVAPTCRVQVNSTKSDALKLGGDAYVEAAEICVGGSYSGGGTSVPVDRNCKPLADPLAAWNPPQVGACEKVKTHVNSNETLLPGIYCGDMTINEGAVVTFSAGVYIIVNGKLKISDGAKVTGYGVGILLAGSSVLEVSHESSVDLVAPVSGPMAGIVFAHDRNAKEGIEHKVSGKSSIHYEGAVYFPKQKIVYKGESQSYNVPPFTTFIVSQLRVDGGSQLILNNDYAASAVPVAGKIGAGIVLVE